MNALIYDKKRGGSRSGIKIIQELRSRSRLVQHRFNKANVDSWCGPGSDFQVNNMKISKNLTLPVPVIVCGLQVRYRYLTSYLQYRVPVLL
jgi:hypothetical protein